MNNGDTAAIKHPSWKHALEQITARGLMYGVTFQTTELAEWLRCDPETAQFSFGMIEIRRHLEVNDGYYMASIEGGKAWRIVEADRHEDVAQKFDVKVRRYAVRSVNLRSATLCNPAAKLATDRRQIMERNLEHASIRLALISRHKGGMKALGNKAEQFTK